MDSAFTADEHFRRGVALLDADDAQGAHACFRTAYGLDQANPTYRSFYGLGLALVEGRFSKALELCRSAAKDEFYNPQLYLNLARVHLCFGFKAEGVRYLRRGLMIDPEDADLRAELARMGCRQSPVLSFLPRRHLLNRWLGRIRQRLWGPGAPTDAAAQPVEGRAPLTSV